MQVALLKEVIAPQIEIVVDAVRVVVTGNRPALNTGSLDLGHAFGKRTLAFEIAEKDEDGQLLPRALDGFEHMVEVAVHVAQ